MKISELTSYPHPVLAPWSSDIEGASFDVVITKREDEDANQLSLHCAVNLSQADLEELLRSGRAQFGCFITCRETGMRRLQQFSYPAGNHDFLPGAMIGRVQLRPMIWSVVPVPGYNPAGAHEEFGSGSNVGAGQILALDDEQIIDVGRPALAPIESIFEILSSEDFAEGRFELNAELDKVTVTMSVKTYDLVQHLRQSDQDTKAVVMNALYVPIIMELLDLAADEEAYAGYRWFDPFMKRCELAEINFDKLSLLNDAQKLLSKPFASLGLLVEMEGE